MFDMAKLMKQAQQMQKDIEGIQQELAQTEISGSAGGGAVTVVCDGRGDLKSIKITPEAMEDKDTLEDLILTAVRETLAKATELSQQKMGSVTQGLNLPGLPFGK
jgi:nucleoid-associated protein EbfC